MNFKTILTSAAVLAAMAIPAAAIDPTTAAAAAPIVKEAAPGIGEAVGDAAKPVGKAIGENVAGGINTVGEDVKDIHDWAKGKVTGGKKEKASESFTYEERAVLQRLAADVKVAMAKVGLPVTLPVSTLRISGDRERYLEGLLKNSVTGAGLNYVEGRNDPMWNEIVAEIKWDDLKDDLLDEATLTKFGRLQAARLLLYGRLIVDADKKGRPRAELVLHASSTETKQHLWGDIFVFPRPKLPGERDEGNIHEPAVYFLEPVASLLTVKVLALADDGTLNDKLAGRLIPIAEDALVKGEFKVVPKTGTADVIVRFEPKMDAKDRTADFVAFRGQVPVDAYLPMLDNKSLGTGRIEKTGDLIQDDDPALSSLVAKIDQPLRDWIAQHVTAEKCGLRVEDVTVSYRDYEADETSARITQFCNAAAKLRGPDGKKVVSCTLAERLATGNKAVYRVVYEAGAFPNGFVHALIAAAPTLELIPELAK